MGTALSWTDIVKMLFMFMLYFYNFRALVWDPYWLVCMDLGGVYVLHGEVFFHK
jgi:hypothetical protein